MNKPKILITILFLLCTGYTILASITFEVSNNNKICNNQVLRYIASWNSGCFYSSLNKKNTSDDQIDFEKKMLDRFMQKQGVEPAILWYRLKFHQEHQNKFRISFQDIHNMYLDYTLAEHFQLIRQVDYLSFLRNNDLIPLSQTTLNNFCNTYIRDTRKDLVIELGRLLVKYKLPISIEHCMNRKWVRSKWAPEIEG